MKLIKKYLNELKSLKTDEVSGKSVTNISNSFYAKARDNKLGNEAELENLLRFAIDFNEVAYAYGRSKKNNSDLIDEIGDMIYNFNKATQKELKAKMAKTFRKLFIF